MSVAERATALVSLEGKVAVVTGGASGIGLGAAKRLAGMGASIAIMDINEATGTKAVEQIEQLGADARFFPCDVRSDADCERSVAGTIQAFGKIDILFNNAGIAIRKNTVDLTVDEWDRALDITLKGVYLMSHHAIPHMIENGGGSIINTGSGWSLKGGPNAVAYCGATLIRHCCVANAPNWARTWTHLWRKPPTDPSAASGPLMMWPAPCYSLPAICPPGSRGPTW